MKVEAPFLDEISGLGIIKLLGFNTYDTVTMKKKFEGQSILRRNKWLNPSLSLDPKRALAILDIRSLGYYKIQGVLQQRLNKYYSFESAIQYIWRIQ